MQGEKEKAWLDLVWFLASLDRCSGVGGFSSCTKGGGRPQDLQEPAWDETKEEKQRAPWAPSLPNLGSSPRATHLQMGGGCGSSARIWQEEGGVEGGRRLRPAGGGPPRASRRRRCCRRPAGSAGSCGRRDLAESKRRRRLG